MKHKWKEWKFMFNNKSFTTKVVLIQKLLIYENEWQQMVFSKNTLSDLLFVKEVLNLSMKVCFMGKIIVHFKKLSPWGVV